MTLMPYERLKGRFFPTIGHRNPKYPSPILPILSILLSKPHISSLQTDVVFAHLMTVPEQKRGRKSCK